MKNFNPLNANPTKLSNTLFFFLAFADELFRCVRPFCGGEGGWS